MTLNVLYLNKNHEAHHEVKKPTMHCQPLQMHFEINTVFKRSNRFL